MIQIIEIKKYRILENIRCEIQQHPFVVIVGQNATGKTSFLDCLAQMQGKRVFPRAEKSSNTNMAVLMEHDGKEILYVDDNTMGLNTMGLKFPPMSNMVYIKPYTSCVQKPLKILLNMAQVQELETYVQKIFPIVEHSHIDTSAEILIDFAHQKNVPMAHLSSGLQNVIYILYTIMKMRQHPSIVLIDDVDQNLHITMQQAFYRAIRDIIEGQPEMQILATAQSPYFVDTFEHNEVFVIGSRPDGTSMLKRLSWHEDSDYRRGCAGEFWASVGEDWIYRQYEKWKWPKEEKK